MANIVPEKRNNFAVYVNGNNQAGIAEAAFPSGEFMTSDVQGAGIAGKVTSPALGHLDSLEVELTWRNTTGAFTELLEPRAHTIDMYAEDIDFDAGKGEYKSHSVHVFMKAVTKTFDVGKLVVNDSSETKTTHEVYYMKLYIDGKMKLEIDKYNFIYKVGTTDYLSSTRKALGMK